MQSVTKVSSHRPDVFRFPCEFDCTDRLSISQLESRLDRERYDRPERKLDVYIDYIPDRQSPTKIIIRCRDCTAKVLFLRHGVRFILAKLANEHVHWRQQQSPNLEYLELGFSSVRQSTASLSDSAGSIRQQLNELLPNQPTDQQEAAIAEQNGSEDPKEPRKPKGNCTERDPNEFDQMKAYLLGINYRVEVEWPEHKYPTYPTHILFLSPRMNAHYERYGQVLSFEIVTTKLALLSDKATYYSILFGVADSNERLRLSGVVFCTDLSPESLGKAVRLMMKCRKTPPSVLLTRNEKKFGLTVQWVKKNWDSAVYHAVDVQEAAFQIDKQLKVFYKNKSYAQRTDHFDRLFKSESKGEAEYILSRGHSTKMLDSIHERLKTMRKLLFLSDMPQVFVGINRDLGSKLFEALEPLRVGEIILSMKTYLTNLQVLESFSQHNCELVLSMSGPKTRNHPRLEEVEQLYEGVVVSRLCQNLKNTKSYKCQSHLFQEGRLVTQVMHTKFKDTFIVDDWVCSCKELAKTGVPCEHLLFVAVRHPFKSYAEMIHPRWLKNQAGAS